MLPKSEPPSEPDLPPPPPPPRPHLHDSTPNGQTGPCPEPQVASVDHLMAREPDNHNVAENSEQ